MGADNRRQQNNFNQAQPQIPTFNNQRTGNTAFGGLFPDLNTMFNGFGGVADQTARANKANQDFLQPIRTVQAQNQGMVDLQRQKNLGLQSMLAALSGGYGGGGGQVDYARQTPQVRPTDTSSFGPRMFG